MYFRRRVQCHHVRPRDRAQRPVIHARDPRNRAAVVEAQHQLHAHPHTSSLAAHQADDVGVAVAGRHEVDEEDGAVGRLDARLENQGVAAIAARDAGAFIGRFDQPPAVLRAAEQRRKARGRVEAGPAEPVDRSCARHQCRGLAVADQRVVLQWRPHRRDSVILSIMQEESRESNSDPSRCVAAGFERRIVGFPSMWKRSSQSEGLHGTTAS